MLYDEINSNINKKLMHQKKGAVISVLLLIFVVSLFILFWKQILIICGISLIGFIILCFDSFKR